MQWTINTKKKYNRKGFFNVDKHLDDVSSESLSTIFGKSLSFFYFNIQTFVRTHGTLFFHSIDKTSSTWSKEEEQKQQKQIEDKALFVVADSLILHFSTFCCFFLFCFPVNIFTLLNLITKSYIGKCRYFFIYYFFKNIFLPCMES